MRGMGDAKSEIPAERGQIHVKPSEKIPYDRRDFLKVAAGGVGALGVGTLVANSTARAQTQVAESFAAKPAVDASPTTPAALPARSPWVRLHD